MKMVLTTIAVISVLFFSVQYAEAEIFSIEGKNADLGIFIFIEDRDNIMKIYTENGDVEFFDSKVKIYKSGGFSIKNYGVGVWGHPISSSQYDLVIMTSEGVQRITASAYEVNEVSNTEESPQRIEPKSSIGADISKYDIPIITRDDRKESMLLTLKIDRPVYLKPGDDYDMNAVIYNARGNHLLEDAKITVQLSRDGYVIRELNDISDKVGKVRLQFNNLDYPEFYPGFCYQVKAFLEYGNVTSTYDEDFAITNVLTGSLDYSWLEQTRWDYLPQSFRNIPPQSLTEDQKCN